MTSPHLPQPLGAPIRGDIWVVDLEPIRGHEQGGTRPALVVSADGLNQSRAGLIVVLPMTTVRKGIPWHIQLDPPEGSVRETSYIKCEDIRSISTSRLIERWGTASRETMGRVSDTIRILLRL